VTVTAPLRLAPADGAVIVTLGGVVSEPTTTADASFDTALTLPAASSALTL
jgi:hypothetical protein